jgi:hypothetical protein
MIRKEKLDSALFALQGVLICARQLAYRCANSGGSNEVLNLVDIMDQAEHLPFLIASNDDETTTFRKALEAISNRHGCNSVVAKFDGPAPAGWSLSGSESFGSTEMFGGSE